MTDTGPRKRKLTRKQLTDQIAPLVVEARDVLADPEVPLRTVMRLCNAWYDLEAEVADRYQDLVEDTGLRELDGLMEETGLRELEDLMTVVGLPTADGDW